MSIIINEHDVINDHTRKKFFRINDHAGKSATMLELNSKLNKRTWSFIRYLRVVIPKGSFNNYVDTTQKGIYKVR